MEYYLNTNYLTEIADNCFDKLSLLKGVGKKRLGRTNDPKIKIYSFKSFNSNSFFSALGSGSIVEIQGEFLELDSTDTYQGIFLLKEDGSEYRVSLYISNTLNRQVFQIPVDLESGRYKLELRALNKSNKTLCRAKLKKTLKIV
ncbi:uncharacterized protein with Ig-like fold DUF4469 [Ancylomarina subtilis]|uniref:Uncharacterized protein with Ig-like fold DUF4469 n=1 Tax=Ancylomarina subtilis TaxID=1639035 RepID=A0A4Q7VIS1_9BACT|nr:DUF4469 domain-containing protein [Ancylomarina subtilis]RZT96043.1 uncharacterized protein with Ig-like fold DUF4469 [Ancylomarina subtilis]